MTRPTDAAVDPAEVEKFSSLAAEWWNPGGKFAVLHKFNPVRLEYIREQVTARYRRDPFAPRPLERLSLLDIGCGGGLLCEPMARLGAAVTGIDPSERNISTARVHAVEVELNVDYRACIAEDLLKTSERFDVILAMEVIEHVPSPAAFVATCAALLKPGGLVFIATLNRTLKSFALAIVGAEYMLGWLPKGTHQWEKFISPDELENWLSGKGLTTLDRIGVVYHPLLGQWRPARDLGVNYMIVAQKPVSAAA